MAAKLDGHLGMKLCQPLHVGLVNDGLREGRARLTDSLPVERGIDNDRARHKRGRVGRIRRRSVRLAHLIAEESRPPGNPAGNRPRVRVDQELGGIEPRTRLWLIRAIGAISVRRAWLRVFDVDTPNAVNPREIHAGRLATMVDWIEKAELDPVRARRPNPESRAGSGPGRPQPILFSCRFFLQSGEIPQDQSNAGERISRRRKRNASSICAECGS
jgi:hypothetical protein